MVQSMCHVKRFSTKEVLEVSEKRKDSKGRILRTGESQRKDGTYMYRFVDFRKIRRCVYAATLDELRAKETKIQKDIGNGIDYAGGEITVIELVKRYIGQKPTASIKTKDGYNFVLNLLERDELCYRQIKTVKPSDGKAFFIRMYDKGMQYNTIEKVRSVIKPAFTMAVDDDILRKNPFSFPLSCIVQNSTVKREALREEDIEKFLAYVMNDTCSCRYYDEVVILLGTGLRASELCGLTKDDIDFSRRRICVEKQLLGRTVAVRATVPPTFTWAVVLFSPTPVTATGSPGFSVSFSVTVTLTTRALPVPAPEVTR